MLHYFYSALAPEHTTSEKIRLGIHKLLKLMLHYQGCVSMRSFKLVLIRLGFTSIERLVVLQTRLSMLSERWQQIKARLFEAPSNLLNVSMHFALSEDLLPEIWEQALQLAVPLTLDSHVSMVEFLRSTAPLLFSDSKFTEGSLIKSSRSLVEELVCRYPEPYADPSAAVLRQFVYFYDKLLELVLTSLLTPTSPEVSRARPRSHQMSPQIGGPRYSKPKLTSPAKTIFEAEFIKKQKLWQEVPTVHVNVMDLLEERPRQTDEDPTKRWLLL